MRPAAEMLVFESRALPVIVARQSPEALNRPTVLPGWRVRDVIAHCGAALRRLVDGDVLEFTPQANQIDVDERRSWPMEHVVKELVEVYPAAAAAIDAAGGAFDGLGLGEWIHGGDLREPLGEPNPYGGPGVDLALPLLVSRSVAREAPGVRIDLDDRPFTFGVGEPIGDLRTDPATFVRLCAGRAPSADRYELSGVPEQALLLFS
jgi:uncharacterized protein (TIGR03083 family)